MTRSSSSTTVDVGATWFKTHYGQMTALAGVVILHMLLASTLQAVIRQNPGATDQDLLVAAASVALLASGCSVITQKTAQNDVTTADTTACHTFGRLAILSPHVLRRRVALVLLEPGRSTTPPIARVPNPARRELPK